MVIEHQPPRSSLPLGWIIAISGFGLLITICFALMIIGGFGRRVAVSTTTGSIRIEPVQRPMVVTEGYPASAAAQSGETALNASNADQVIASGNETTFTKTFALDDGAAFSLKNINGSITVTAWDQPKAEVKAIQSGSDAQVFFMTRPNNLAIRSGVARNSSSQDIRYEMKLPREMGRVQLSSLNGSIKVSGVSGQIIVESTNGNIDLTDVCCVSKVQTANGKITAVLQEAAEGPMEFAGVNGKMDLTIKSGFDATLEASTVHGGIDIDDQFGIQVQKEVVGQRARGEIGSGGQLLKLSTVNGGIKLTNANTQSGQIGSGGQRLKLTTVNGSIKVTNGNTHLTTAKGKKKLAK